MKRFAFLLVMVMVSATSMADKIGLSMCLGCELF